MGKKTTLAKGKKAKTAARSSKGAPKAKAAPSRKRSAKDKPDEKTLRNKSAEKGIKAPVKTPLGASGDKTKAPKASAKAQKADKLVKSSSAETKTAGKTASRDKSTGQPTTPAKTSPGPSKPIPEPREIAGLPKLPAFGSIFERPSRKDAKKPKTSEDGGNGEPSDDSSSETLARTYLSDAELEEFRQLLLSKRQEIVRDVTNLEDEAIRQASGASTSSSMPIHMADLGTDTWEQELTLGLIENERNLLREIDEAIERIDNRTYGICLATNKRISKARLQAKPWAKYCIEYARRRELGLA
ncbi:MAG TPA: TraR/DksA C4-type zinc finger protein [Phycisphaerae bacterium]|nr:TraR/DksA C4-type zinc finger protein [Phycisphaerae bacterium]HRR86262.1 TraR/DksA C4-type zinc finger protein [Phycisphaerae bacterium]